MDQADLKNDAMKARSFLASMYDDGYFPDHLINEAKALLVALCAEIEAEEPSADAELLVLTHATVEDFNDLAETFEENDSEIETVAREAIAEDFAAIVAAYGFDIDIEEVIAPRDW